MSFYKKQLRIALRNCGHINPEDITEYLANDGYLALAKCLSEMTPEQVIQEIKASGLKVEVVPDSQLVQNGKHVLKILL